MASLVFDGNEHSIAGFSYVDFWVENEEGIGTESKMQGALSCSNN